MTAGNIDQLNFGVILNDADFNTQVQKDIALAQKLNTSLSGLMNVKLSTRQIISSTGVKNAQQMSQHLTDIANKIQSMPKGSFLVGDADKLNTTLQQVSAQLDKIIKKQEQHGAALGKTNSQAYNMARILRTISTLTGSAFSIYGLRRFLSALIDITGQFEVQRMALRNMLQDIDGADKIFQDLYRFSSDSTYRFSELAKYAKQLAAFNIDKSDLLETTKMLGDVASGVGVSMDRVILAYGHVKSSGFLRGIQLRSFSQNGIPVLEELSKILTEVEGKAVSLGDVFDKMTKREIPFEMVEQAFKNMTSEGGKFYQMQEVLAKTLAGQINILKGRWENMLAAIGQANDGLLKGSVAKLNDLVLNYDKLGGILKEVILVFGAYRGAIIATTAVTQGLAAATNIGLLGALKNVAKWVATNPWAILAAAAVYLVVEVRKAEKALTDIQKITKALDDVTEQYNRSLASEIGELDALYAGIKNAHEGTEEYASAKLALEKRFDPYIQKLREEGAEVNNLSVLYEGLARKITEANKQRYLETAQKDLLTAYDNVSDAVEKEVKHIIKQLGDLTADQEGAIRHFVRTGEMNQNYKSISGLEGRELIVEDGGRGRNVRRDDSTFQQRLSALRQKLDLAGVVYSDEMGKAAKKFDADMASTIGNSTRKALEGWRKTVQDTLYGIDQDFEKTFMPKENEDYFEYLERVGKHYKEVNEYKDKALEKDKQIYQRELDAIQKIDKALEGNILSDARYTKEPWNGSGNAKLSPLQKAYIAMMEETEDWLEKEFNKSLDQNTKELEKQLDKRMRALEDYEKFYKDWAGTDFGKEGTGAAYKVSSIITEYNNKNKAADDKYYKGLALVQEGHKGNAEAIKREAKELRKLRDAQKEMNRVDFMEKLRGTADDIFKQGMFGYDLTDWSDKSLSDILAISDAIKNLSIPEEVAKQLSPEELAAVDKELESIKNKFMQGTVIPALTKNAVKPAKQIAEYLGKAGDAMIRLGEAVNDSGLTDAGKALNAISQNLDAAAKGYEAAQSMGAGAYSWIGAVVGGLTDIFGQVTDAVGEANEKMKQMEDTIRSVASTVRNEKFDELLSGGVDGIFGENFVKRIRNAMDAINGLSNSISDLEEKRRSFFEWILKEQIGKPGHATSDTIPRIIAGSATPDVGNMEFITDHNWWSGNTYKKLSEIAKEFNMEMEDVNGNLNPKLLQQILDTYGDLNQGAKDWLIGSIDYANEYDKAMKQIEDATKEVFDNLASDLTDQFIDNFLAMGNAVDDLSDTFANLGDTILRSFLQSYILEEILGKYKNDATAALKKYTTGQMTPEDYAAWLDGFASNVQKESETLAPAINGMIAAFRDRGLMNIDSDTANSLGSGIKGITEDTANLLASYFNAVRADVSVMRGIQEKNLPEIAGAIPTLNDYLAQCAANTYDLAQSNQSILSELRSVIGSPDTSGMIVRVQTV